MCEFPRMVYMIYSFNFESYHINFIKYCHILSYSYVVLVINSFKARIRTV